MVRVPAPVLLPLALLAASCGTGEAPTAPPRPRAVARPPSVPELSALDVPRRGHATVAQPRWDAEHMRFDHPLRALAAGFATQEHVIQILLGESAQSGVVLDYFGSRLAEGDHPVLPATDETSQQAGRDTEAFTVTSGQTQGALRSASGSVTITGVDDSHIAGTLDVTVRSQNLLRETRVRARFDATPSRELQVWLDHQQAIRERLRRR